MGRSANLRQTTFEVLGGLTLGRGLEQDARAGPPAQQGRALHARRVDALLQHDGAIAVLDADVGVLLVHVHANLRHGGTTFWLARRHDR